MGLVGIWISGFDLGDAGKTILLMACIAGLYVLARWTSRLNETRPSVSNQPLAPTTKVIPITSTSRVRTPFPEPPADENGPVRITNMYFATFDLAPGPPDHESFADELFVELVNVENGYNWTQTFFVATPAGLSALLRTNNWSHAFAESVILLRRYNVSEIKQAVLDRLKEEVEIPAVRNTSDDYIG